MAQRRHPAERAFERLLRARRIPYVAVSEARKSLLPGQARLTIGTDAGTLKNFDFIVYGQNTNLLVEVKGRTIPRAKRPDSASRPRLESWVTEDDIHALRTWTALFGDGYEPVFVFVYRCEGQPPDGLFDEVFEHDGQWFVVRAIGLDAYASAMRTRSPRWRTVHLSQDDFDRLSGPFAAPSPSGTVFADPPPMAALEPIGA